jgi:hypothetical protein
LRFPRSDVGASWRATQPAADHWNNILGNQAIKTLWVAYSDDKTKDQQYNATVAALAGIAPRVKP